MIGTIFLATNPMEVNNIRAIRARMRKTNKHKVIVVDDMCNSNNPNEICGSILLPSASSLINMTDANDTNSFGQFIYEYQEKLTNDPYVCEYLAMLIAGVMQYGIDYIFYYDGTNDINVLNTLYMVLHNIYGLVFVGYQDLISNLNLVFNSGVDPRFVPNLMNFIQKYGYFKEDQSGKLFMNIS